MSGSTGGDSMEKIDVRVPAAVLEAIDEEYPRRGYTSRSEAIRDAIRDWLTPSPELSSEVLDDLERSRMQRERGETLSAEEARDRLGLDDETATSPSESSDNEPDEFREMPNEFEEQYEKFQNRLEEMHEDLESEDSDSLESPNDAE